jgi:hypothetical protein
MIKVQAQIVSRSHPRDRKKEANQRVIFKRWSTNILQKITLVLNAAKFSKMVKASAVTWAESTKGFLSHTNEKSKSDKIAHSTGLCSNAQSITMTWEKTSSPLMTATLIEPLSEDGRLRSTDSWSRKKTFLLEISTNTKKMRFSRWWWISFAKNPFIDFVYNP